MNPAYLDSVRLLLAAAPEALGNGPFALKGGTAINLFHRNMPRLSVDLDVVFTDHRPNRVEALMTIRNQLQEVGRKLEGRGLFCNRGGNSAAEELKLFVRRNRTQIKIEVNHVFRGTLLPVRSQPLTEEAQDLFFTDLQVPMLHPDELYGSKLVAAMDRQHPRDLFDVLMLYESEGLSDGIVECFVCYLAGHNRPVHEVLFPNEISIDPAFTNEFRGMTREPVDLECLLHVRRRLFAELPSRLSGNQKSFLTGLVEGAPDWSLMPFDQLPQLPAIRWKQANLEQLRETNPRKFALQSAELIARLGG